uniref:Uncharacterized protein n=1 Tax=Equus asinus TaxID=9793 RepID=A0A9L0K2H2_EQUAS
MLPQSGLPARAGSARAPPRKTLPVVTSEASARGAAFPARPKPRQLGRGQGLRRRGRRCHPSGGPGPWCLAPPLIAPSLLRASARPPGALSSVHRVQKTPSSRSSAWAPATDSDTDNQITGEGKRAPPAAVGARGEERVRWLLAAVGPAGCAGLLRGGRAHLRLTRPRRPRRPPGPRRWPDLAVVPRRNTVNCGGSSAPKFQSLGWGVATPRLLEDWCRGMDVNPRKTLLIAGILQTCSVAEMEEALRAGLAPLGEYRLLGRMFRRDENRNVALTGLPQETGPALVPKDTPGKGGVWRVIFNPRDPDDAFLSRLNEFLEGEGMTLCEFARALGYGNGPFDLDQDMIPEVRAPMLAQALPEALQPALQYLEYKKMRIFSVSDPPEPDQEEFEPWLFHTTQMIKSWRVSDAEKRR